MQFSVWGSANEFADQTIVCSGAADGSSRALISATCIDLSLSCMQRIDAYVQARNAKTLMPNRTSPQILSDKALLDTMMRGQHAAGYAPSSHWGSPKSATLAALHAVDLNDFLTVPNSFGNFPASHLERPNMFRRIGHRFGRNFLGL